MVPQADVRQLSTALDDGALVIDVREPFEYASGHVPGAVPMAMHLVPLHVGEIPVDRAVFVICATGNRSWQVCQYLTERGITATNVHGGTMAWASAGFAMETSSADAGVEPIGGAHQ
ncbi:MAG: rhodanese-like domain-containing protein [Actinomycetia bacterium]|nr:rhodanese-like domain-containing protein [Actinomycetes bacterium]